MQASADPEGTRIIWPDRPADVEISLDVPAPGKPRMTQRSKWRKTPGITKYYAFADRLRAEAPSIPAASTVVLLAVTAYYAPPRSWSRKKTLAAFGSVKRSKPDGSNILKGVEDILWPNDDQALGDCHVGRWWATRDAVFVSIWTA